MVSNKKVFIILSITVCLAVVGFLVYRLIAKEDAPKTLSSTNNSTTQSEQSQQNQTTNQPNELTPAAVAQHASESDCWTIINGNVYDITQYIPRHPGGDDVLLACGKDGTTLFTQRETESGEAIGSGTPHNSGAQAQLEQFIIGTLQQ